MSAKKNKAARAANTDKTTPPLPGGKAKNLLGVLLPVAAFAAVVAALMLRGAGEAEPLSSAVDGSAYLNEQGDLVIPVGKVTETAAFYPVETEGVALEVLAVRATDGSVRTAFNTCQVCFDSGRGYYRQQGEYLVCQNCGNRFHTDAVELVRGGCNPIPITDAYKSADSDSITIPADFLAEASALFTNWRG